MKKILVILLSFFFSLNIMAQHISFLGKPLGCSIKEFKQRMIERGYVSNGEVEKGVYTFDGLFGGDNTLIAAYITPKSQIVYTVGIFYNDYKSYKNNDISLESQKYKFNSLNSILLKKYGIASIARDLYSLWEVESGEIILIVNSPNTFGQRNLILWYKDSDGNKKRNEENISDY